MKNHFFTITILALAGLCLSCCQTTDTPLFARGSTIALVVPNQTTPLELIALDELRRYLSRLYPNHQFPIQHTIPEKDPAIALGTLANFPDLSLYIAGNELKQPESFIVAKIRRKGQPLGIIAGADERGLLYGVYALLEEIGFGFYLTGDAVPSPRKGAFDFTAWNFKDAPIAGERIALNWHNFLSGCSSWNLDDWQKWIAQLSKMRFNTIMVHAYGNNPMDRFAFNGQEKPVGYLSTTQKGRDWGTQHVNDVRRLIGGKELFDNPVFGSNAAQVPGDERSTAAVSLMQQVFSYADERGMKVIYAVDIDTISANPANTIHTLPPEARLTVQGSPVANPDTPEGYDYYQARVQSLLHDYPQIDRIALWFRRHPDISLGTIWRAIQVEEFPPDWKREYQQKLSEHLEIASDPEGPSLFAIGKIAQAYRKALDAMGRQDISLAAGSWGYDFIPAAHVFLPQEISLTPLDSDINLYDAESTQRLGSVSQNRQIIPIVWAQHDDHSYWGRPYLPYPHLGSYLSNNRFSGLGIIHWTTRPLDLFFKNIAKQVWKKSLDEPIYKTCKDTALRQFGLKFREPVGEYLIQWIHNAPQFGRETAGRFIDRPLHDGEAVIAECQKRRTFLSDIDPHTMTPEAKRRFQYYKWLEEFTIQFYQNQNALDRCLQYLQKNQIAQIYETLEQCKPESAIEQFAQLSQLDGPTPGEKGLLVSLNLRWYPYFISLRQSLREESIRINFLPTQHDSLAQAPGNNTFFIDKNGKWWIGMGQKETGCETFELNEQPGSSSESYSEIGQTGIRITQKTEIRLAPFANRSVASGDYQAHLFFVEPQYEKVGERIFQLTMWEEAEGKNALKPFVKERIDIVQRAGGRNRVVQLTYPIDMQNGVLIVELLPIRSDALLCGAILEPVELQQREIY